MGYPMNFTISDRQKTYKFDVTCRGSVPEAIQAFIESTDFESAIRLAVSIGGDSDTIASIAGALAEVVYPIPRCMIERVRDKLGLHGPQKPLNVVTEFYAQLSNCALADTRKCLEEKS